MPTGNVVSIDLRVRKGLFDRRSEPQSKPVNGSRRLDGEQKSERSEAGADYYDPGLRRYDCRRFTKLSMQEILIIWNHK